MNDELVKRIFYTFDWNSVEHFLFGVGTSSIEKWTADNSRRNREILIELNIDTPNFVEMKRRRTKIRSSSNSSFFIVTRHIVSMRDAVCVYFEHRIAFVGRRTYQRTKWRPQMKSSESLIQICVIRIIRCSYLVWCY